jgi:ethanolamine transporter EutH
VGYLGSRAHCLGVVLNVAEAILGLVGWGSHLPFLAGFAFETVPPWIWGRGMARFQGKDNRG